MRLRFYEFWASPGPEAAVDADQRYFLKRSNPQSIPNHVEVVLVNVRAEARG